jgi:hypothetical protein
MNQDTVIATRLKDDIASPCKTLPRPSDKLKALIDKELALPKYQGEDEDITMIDALKTILTKHGEAAFDPLNYTDRILLGLTKD